MEPHDLLPAPARAARLQRLLNPDCSITEVAHALGYCDSAHFTHMFKKHQGITPIAYRNRYTSAREQRNGKEQ